MVILWFQMPKEISAQSLADHQANQTKNSVATGNKE